MRKYQSGVTLVELMVVVVTVAILMAIAVPSYRGYMMRVNRVDATSALLRIAAAQEKFYLQASPAQYAENGGELANAPPNGLGIGTTDRGYYILTVAPDPDNGAGVGYIATADVDGGENQAADTECALFRINEQGVRTAEDSDGADNTDVCWR